MRIGILDKVVLENLVEVAGKDVQRILPELSSSESIIIGALLLPVMICTLMGIDMSDAESLANEIVAKHPEFQDQFLSGIKIGI